jgi:hypothetical protein
MKHKGVIEYTTSDDLPFGTQIYQSIVNWTSKTNLGVYVKTKCRICFGGHRYDKSYSGTFTLTVNFCTVLIMICLAAIFGWHLGSLDCLQTISYRSMRVWTMEELERTQMKSKITTYQLTLHLSLS